MTKVVEILDMWKRIITVTRSNKKNLDSDSGFCILFFTKIEVLGYVNQFYLEWRAWLRKISQSLEI